MVLRLLGAACTFILLIGGDAANAANTITLTGTVPVLCSLAVNTLPAATGIALQTTTAARGGGGGEKEERGKGKRGGKGDNQRHKNGNC